MRLVKAPLGLLELFRLRDQGQNPNLFSDGVQSVADVRDFYGADLLTPENTTGAPGAIAAGVSAGAALNTRRYIMAQGGINIGAAAGTSLCLTIMAASPGGSSVIGLASMQIVTPVIGQTYRVSANLTAGLVLPPGWGIQLAVDGNAAGADHVPFLRTAYQRLDGVN